MQTSVEQRQRFGHGVGHKRRKRAAQVAPGYAAGVGGAHVFAGVSRSVRKEIAHGLRRSLIGLPTCGDGSLVCCAFHVSLQLHACKRIGAFEIFGADAHQKRAVGVAPVAREAAHAVDHDAARLAGRADHFPARAHAERVHAATLLVSGLLRLLRLRAQVHRQLVIGRAEGGMVGSFAILRAVDELLRMLDAHADRERFLLHMHAGVADELERVAGRMAAGKDDAARGDALDGAGCNVGELGGGKFAVFEPQARQLSFEPHLAASVSDLVAHGAHDVDKQVGADVGLGLPEDFLGGAGFDEQVQHVARPGAFDVRSEFAVRERARASFAELDVRVRVEFAAGVECVNGGQTVVDCSAALDDKRAQAGARQVQRAKQARGARAHHDGARLGSGTRRGCSLRNLQWLVGLVRLHVRRAFAAGSRFDCGGFGLRAGG